MTLWNIKEDSAHIKEVLAHIKEDLAHIKEAPVWPHERKAVNQGYIVACNQQMLISSQTHGLTIAILIIVKITPSNSAHDYNALASRENFRSLLRLPLNREAAFYILASNAAII